MDLGWYPDAEADGEYYLKVVVGPDWQPLIEYCSNDRFKIKAELEEILADENLIHPFSCCHTPQQVEAKIQYFQQYFNENYD